LRSNPEISVGGLGHHVGYPSKNSILYPPCGVPILRDLPTGIECADRTYGYEKQDKAEQKSQRALQLARMRMSYALFAKFAWEGNHHLPNFAAQNLQLMVV
jgi:hypothetical protein